MRTCPDCGGTGRISHIPWTDHRGRPEQNPENEVDRPCRRCNESGEIGVREVSAVSAVSRDVGVGRDAQSGPRTTWLCGICGCVIHETHLKRHLAAHDRHGTLRQVTNDEWCAYLKATGQWSVSNA